MRIVQQHLAATLQSIGDAVIATDRDDKITFINPVATTLTGWAEADALGQPLGAVYRVRRDDGGHLLLDCRNGATAAIAGGSSPLRTGHATAAGDVVVFRDVTESRRREAHARFVAQASEALLTASLDYEERLATAASLAVPSFADWAAVDMIGADGSVRRLATCGCRPAQGRRRHGDRAPLAE